MAAEVHRRTWWEEHGRQVDTAAALLVVAGTLLFFVRLFIGDRALDLGYYFTTVPKFGNDPVWFVLVKAAGLSVLATVLAFAAGLPLGFFTGWARTLEAPPLLKVTAGLQGRALAQVLLLAGARRFLRRMADFYVELVRGTPLMVQVVFVWSIVLVATPGWGPASQGLMGGVLAMMINTGGYQGEIFRGGLQAVHHGQLEAARALGLSRLGTMAHVVLPQTLRLVMPPLTNEFISLFKSSTLLFVIGVAELASVSKSVSAFNPRIFEVFLITTGIYLLITVPLSRSVGLLERRLRIPGLGLEAAAKRGPRRPREGLGVSPPVA